MARVGWTRNDARSKTAAVYTHTSGWRVVHCGHPTALWPYYLLSPEGLELVASNGHGFRLLVDAQVAVERFLNGERIRFVDITGRHSTTAGTGLLRRAR